MLFEVTVEYLNRKIEGGTDPLPPKFTPDLYDVWLLDSENEQLILLLLTTERKQLSTIKLIIPSIPLAIQLSLFKLMVFIMVYSIC